jgi:hypothetical protein
MDKRLHLLRRADAELAERGAPPANLLRALSLWEEAIEQLESVLLSEYTEDEADALLGRISSRDIALMAVGLALSERPDGEGWYDLAVGLVMERYDRILGICRVAEPYEYEYPRVEGVRLELYPSDAAW